MARERDATLLLRARTGTATRAPTPPARLASYGIPVSTPKESKTGKEKNICIPFPLILNISHPMAFYSPIPWLSS